MSIIEHSQHDIIVHPTLVFVQCMSQNTPADWSNLPGCQTWGYFWVFAAGYSVANPK